MGAELLRNTNYVVNTEECIHGISAANCSACHPDLDLSYSPPPRKIAYQLKKRPEGDKSSPVEGLHLWGANARPSGPPEKVTAIHISVNPMQNLLGEIIDTYPNLKVIEVSQGRYNQYLDRTGAMQLLAAGGIEVRIGRWNQKGKSYLDRIESCGYYDRRQFLLNLTDKQQQRWQRLAHLGFNDEIDLTGRYFCLADPKPPRISFVDLGAEHGLGRKKVRKRVTGLIGFLGCPYLPKDKPAQQAVTGFEKRVERATKAEKQAEIRVQYEEFRPLPQGLRPAHWQTFLNLTRIQHQSPELLESLSDERISIILNHYYGLEGQVHTLEEIRYFLHPSTSNEKVRQLRNIGLALLNILEE